MNRYFFLVFLLKLAALHAQTKEIKVEINRNIEVINAITIPLYPEMLQDSGKDPWMYRNTQAMRTAHAFFKNSYQHPAMEASRKLIKKLGTGIYLLALYYEELPQVKRKVAIPQLIWQELSSNQDSALFMIDSFMRLAADFYQAADFPGFQKKYASYYAHVIADIQKSLPNSAFVSVLERYYGDQKNSYTIIAMPFFKSQWGMGWEVADNGKRNIVNIAAPFEEQQIAIESKTKTGYDNADEIANLSVHEFGHSFVNALTSQEPYTTDINRYAALFKPIKSQQQYNDWLTLFNEYVVRAGEILVMEQLGNKAFAQKTREHYKDWVYLDHFIAQMQHYQKNRKKYPTFQSFLPALIQSLHMLKT